MVLIFQRYATGHHYMSQTFIDYRLAPQDAFGLVAFDDTALVIGGAGGYLPDARTPEVWAQFSGQIARAYEG